VTRASDKYGTYRYLDVQFFLQSLLSKDFSFLSARFN
jgi:hypothetical protein